MAEIIAIGTTAVNSSSFTLTDGASTTILLKDAAGTDVNETAFVRVQMQSSGGEWFNIAVVKGCKNGQVLTAPGTFRIAREEVNTAGGGAAFGVDRS